MRTTRPPVVDGLSLALQAASSDTSTSTTARIQASYAIVTDFFNGLLGHQKTCAFGESPARHKTERTAFGCHSWQRGGQGTHTFHCSGPGPSMRSSCPTRRVDAMPFALNNVRHRPCGA